MSGDPRVEAAARAQYAHDSTRHELRIYEQHVAELRGRLDAAAEENAGLRDGNKRAVEAYAELSDELGRLHSVVKEFKDQNDALAGRLDATRTALAALEPIAERSCENYTSGPGSCIRAGRKTVSNGPDFTGTADEICYACACWAARRVLEETQ